MRRWSATTSSRSAATLSWKVNEVVRPATMTSRSRKYRLERQLAKEGLEVTDILLAVYQSLKKLDKERKKSGPATYKEIEDLCFNIRKKVLQLRDVYQKADTIVKEAEKLDKFGEDKCFLLQRYFVVRISKQCASRVVLVYYIKRVLHCYLTVYASIVNVQVVPTSHRRWSSRKRWQRTSRWPVPTQWARS